MTGDEVIEALRNRVINSTGVARDGSEAMIGLALLKAYSLGRALSECGGNLRTEVPEATVGALMLDAVVHGMGARAK